LENPLTEDEIGKRNDILRFLKDDQYYQDKMGSRVLSKTSYFCERANGKKVPVSTIVGLFDLQINSKSIYADVTELARLGITVYSSQTYSRFKNDKAIAEAIRNGSVILLNSELNEKRKGVGGGNKQAIRKSDQSTFSYNNIEYGVFKNAVSDLFDRDSLDEPLMSSRRIEHDFLRGYLFQGKLTDTCGICQKELPVNLLVTAHIKKRSKCSIVERLDYKSIVMPMCALGCDALYEKKYIGVENEIVTRLKNYGVTSDLDIQINQIVGKRCSYWNVNTEKYFRWHVNNL
jgi:hypothetical protein